MSKNVLILLAFILFCASTTAQNETDSITVSGKIIEAETNQPLEYATISFFSKAENKIIGGGITDLQGEFKIKTTPGAYDIYIEYFSFMGITKLNINLNQDTNFGSLKMKADLQALDAVDIIAEKTTVEIKLDK
jgi:hypothetical protein